MPRNRPHQAEVIKEQARALKRRGFTNSMISDELGIPRSTIGDWTKGIESPGFITNCSRCGEEILGFTRKRSVCTHCSKGRDPNKKRRRGTTPRERLIKDIEEAIPFKFDPDDSVWNYKMRNRQKRLKRLLDRVRSAKKHEMKHLRTVFDAVSQPARMHD